MTNKIDDIKSVIGNVLDETGTSYFHNIVVYSDGDDPLISLDGEYTVETLERICRLLRLAQEEINIKK